LAIIEAIPDMESEMNDHNLEDLIIEDPEPGKKKPKKIVTLIALIIIILISGTMLTKMIFGNGENEGEKSVRGSEKVVDKELSPITSPIETKTQKRDDEVPDELAPIDENQLPTPPQEKREKRAPAMMVEELKAPAVKEEKLSLEDKGAKESAHKPAEKAPIHKSEKRVEQKVRKVHRKSPKPSELFKHEKSVGSVSGRYYIQIGSFSRNPNQKYLDNISKSGYRYITVKSDNLIKVRVGPYASYEEAKAQLPIIKSKLNVAGFVVKAK
jgi:DedD protein